MHVDWWIAVDAVFVFVSLDLNNQCRLIENVDAHSLTCIQLDWIIYVWIRYIILIFSFSFPSERKTDQKIDLKIGVTNTHKYTRLLTHSLHSDVQTSILFVFSTIMARIRDLLSSSTIDWSIVEDVVYFLEKCYVQPFESSNWNVPNWTISKANCLFFFCRILTIEMTRMTFPFK